jgi:hypothetical protein
LFLFWLNCIKANAPDIEYIYVQKSSGISKFDNLIKAIGYVESKENTFEYNESENAIGYFQIREILIQNFNQRTGKHYLHKDMFNYDKAKEVFLYYAMMYQDFEVIAKRWNGRGKMTEKYWKSVQKRLNVK